MFNRYPRVKGPLCQMECLNIVPNVKRNEPSNTRFIVLLILAAFGFITFFHLMSWIVEYSIAR